MPDVTLSLPQTVGARVRFYRHLRGLTLRALAIKSGRNINTIAAIEKLAAQPTADTLDALAAALGVTAAHLRGDCPLLGHPPEVSHG